MCVGMCEWEDFRQLLMRVRRRVGLVLLSPATLRCARVCGHVWAGDFEAAVNMCEETHSSLLLFTTTLRCACVGEGDGWDNAGGQG